MASYSWFSHSKWWFSIVILVYQRVMSIVGWGELPKNRLWTLWTKKTRGFKHENIRKLIGEFSLKLHLLLFWCGCINLASKQKYKDANIGNEMMCVFCPIFRFQKSNKKVIFEVNFPTTWDIWYTNCSMLFEITRNVGWRGWWLMKLNPPSSKTMRF